MGESGVGMSNVEVIWGLVAVRFSHRLDVVLHSVWNLNFELFEGMSWAPWEPLKGRRYFTVCSGAVDGNVNSCSRIAGYYLQIDLIWYFGSSVPKVSPIPTLACGRHVKFSLNSFQNVRPRWKNSWRLFAEGKVMFNFPGESKQSL